MKKFIAENTVFVLCLLTAATAASSALAYHGAKNVDGTLVIRERGQTILVEGWGRDSLRVRVAPQGSKQTSDWALDIPLQAKGEVEITPGQAVIRNGNISCRISDIYTHRLHMEFFKHDGDNKKRILSEYDYGVHAHNPGVRTFKKTDQGLFHLELDLASHKAERFYGMGLNATTGTVNLKGSVIDLYQRHVKHVVPFVVSSEGYGFLWNNPSLGRVEFGTKRVRWVSRGCKQLDYFITVGDSYADIMSNYADATGHAPEFPYWASGFWQCKLRYKTQDDFLSAAREFKRRGLPLAVHVIDFCHWDVLGNWKLDPKFWPDPEAMVKEMDEMGTRIMISPWILVSPKSENFQHMKANNMFITSRDGKKDTVNFSGAAYQYDPTNPEAGKFLWSKWKQNYFDLGIRTFWLDPADDFHEIDDYDQILYKIGPATEAHCYYPVAHQKNVYQGLVAAGEKEVVTICRSSWAGSQRYGAAPAHHDILSSFEHFEEYMKAYLNLGMSGIPWAATGIGGFVGRDRGERFHELMVRWYQYGVFCPVFRTHGHRPNNEAWNLGGDSYRHVRAAMFLRERLRPYVMKQMALASAKGIPPMRPVFFDFERGDPKTAEIEDQFLFGPDLLVAPITRFEQRSRQVYLPAGTDWTDAWTGKKLKGGQTIEADAPIEHIPVYLRGDQPELLKLFGIETPKDPEQAKWDVPGLIEAEDLKVISHTSSHVRTQAMTQFGHRWRGDCQLVWWGKLTKGDVLILEVLVAKTGQYEVQLHLSKAHDYGIFSFQLDDGPASDPLDIYDPKLRAPTVFKLKPMRLSKGKHQLKIECHGKNPRSINTLMGMDYIVLKENANKSTGGDDK
jgi:alpha-D-xyloside xylohydrolase